MGKQKKIKRKGERKGRIKRKEREKDINGQERRADGKGKVKEKERWKEVIMKINRTGNSGPGGKEAIHHPYTSTAEPRATRDSHAERERKTQTHKPQPVNKITKNAQKKCLPVQL